MQLIAFSSVLASGECRRRVRVFCALMVFLALGQTLPAQAPVKAPPVRPVAGSPFAPKTVPALPYPQEVGRITFAAAGDVIPHQAVVQAAVAHKHTIVAQTDTASAAGGPADNATAAQPSVAAGNTDNHGGWDDLFAEIAGVFRRVDFGFVNLETPVAPEHSRGSRPFQFDAPMSLLESLKSNGVKIVSFANNHVFDQGHAGFNESLDHLRDEGLLFAGSGPSAADAWKPVFTEKNGIKVGWLGMTRWLNGNRNPAKESDPHVAFLPYPGGAAGAPGLSVADALEAIKAARAQCDFLIISIHWGIEYAPEPRPEDVELAHSFLDAGAGLILGHHPHVLQAVETYLTQDDRYGVILFSLGNFLSNQSARYVQGLTPERDGEQRDSLMVTFSVIRKDYGPAGTRVELGEVGILPVWTDNNGVAVRSGREKTMMIRPVFIDRELPKLMARLDELSRPGAELSAEQKKELLQVNKRLELLKRRRELLLARTGDEFLIAPPGQ
jgi:poly-gamma-glutamate synthesis protein (capsule biosynthesis protein)